MARILFTPEMDLEIGDLAEEITIKGRTYRLTYPFDLIHLYPTVPALDVWNAYRAVQREIEKAAKLLCEQMRLREPLLLPIPNTYTEASAMLRALFDPMIYYTDRVFDTAPISFDQQVVFDFPEQASPFPFRLASSKKLLHTLKWIDSNIKTLIEDLLLPFHAKQEIIFQITESALYIYCYVIKMNDFHLARNMNFNTSMFLQERILNLIFGDHAYFETNRRTSHGKDVNKIALSLLKGLDSLSYLELCSLSVFMGVSSLDSEEIRQSFASKPDATLANIYNRLPHRNGEWCINHIPEFLSDLGTSQQITLAVILDDNGESVFDLAIMQRLMTDHRGLTVTFVVNRYPISNNISLGAFRALLEDDYFEQLATFLVEGRATLDIEEQVFRSFEINYLQPLTILHLKKANFAYIKGANFFETFQFPFVDRYYCFVIESPTSMLLTGCTKGNGVFVKISAGETGFVYHTADEIHTLSKRISTKDVNYDS